MRMTVSGRELQAQAWHSVPNKTLVGQNGAVMAVFERSGRDQTLSEVVTALKSLGASWAERSTVNRCLDGLCSATRLERSGERRCTVSGRTVTCYGLPKGQGTLFS